MKVTFYLVIIHGSFNIDKGFYIKNFIIRDFCVA